MGEGAPDMDGRAEAVGDLWEDGSPGGGEAAEESLAAGSPAAMPPPPVVPGFLPHRLICSWTGMQAQTAWKSVTRSGWNWGIHWEKYWGWHLVIHLGLN